MKTNDLDLPVSFLSLVNNDPLNNVRVLHSAFGPERSNWQPWLPSDPFAALLACIGAGPWRFERRRKVQLAAMDSYKNTYIRCGDALFCKEIPCTFPLAWQNNILFHVMEYCCDNKISFNEIVSHIDDKPEYLANALGLDPNKKRKKVVSLFLRDFNPFKRKPLLLQSFPIDRHVARVLKLFNLPQNEGLILSYFDMVCLDPVPVARAVGTTYLSGGNPDWTSWSL